MTNIQVQEKPLNKNTQKIKDETSELLQDIHNKLQKSNEEVKEMNENPNSFFDEKSYKAYQEHVGKNVYLPINRIALSDNVRKHINTNSDEFLKLANDISRNGIQQNVIVELVKTPTGGQLVCVAGHRRITAAIYSGNINVVPALIRQYQSPGDRTQSALAENLLRKDLHCLDVAEGYHRMLEDGWSKDDLVEIFERNEKTIRYYLKMAKWPDEVKDFIRENSEKFSTRILINKFAAKRFESDSDLLKALKATLSTANKDKVKSNKKPTLLKNLKEDLEQLLEQKAIKPEIRTVVRDVFTSLGLVNY